MNHGLDEKKKEEKDKLFEIKAMISETKEKIRKLENEQSKQRILNQKAMRKARKIQLDQENRLGKMNQDLKLMTGLCDSRREELKNLVKFNTDGKDELKKATDRVRDLKTKYQNLENDVKQGYANLQNEKDIQVLMEVGMSCIKEDSLLPHKSLQEILNKRQESVKQRKEEINKEISKIEEEKAAVEVKIKEKKSDLMTLKNTYSNLVRVYKEGKH